MNAFYFVTDEVFLYVANSQALWLRKLWPDCAVHLFVERRDATQVVDQVSDPQIFYHFEELAEFLPPGLPQTAGWPNIVFLRLFAPRLLLQYRRLCYLDSDILAMQSDNGFWDIDLPSGLGMVTDFATINTSPHDLKGLPRDAWLASINVTSGRYANSGMLLIDPTVFADYRFEDSLQLYFHKYPEAKRFDQDFLNSYLDGQWTELGPRFNFQAGVLELGYEQIVDPIFVHFCRFVKPWYGMRQPWRAPTDPRFYGIYARILADAGLQIDDYARQYPLSRWRQARYAIRRWRSTIGLPSGRERRERRKWQNRSDAFWHYVNEGLKVARFADESGRNEIPKTTLEPIFDGRFVRPEVDGTRKPN